MRDVDSVILFLQTPLISVFTNLLNIKGFFFDEADESVSNRIIFPANYFKDVNNSVKAKGFNCVIFNAGTIPDRPEFWEGHDASFCVSEQTAERFSDNTAINNFDVDPELKLLLTDKAEKTLNVLKDIMATGVDSVQGVNTLRKTYNQLLRDAVSIKMVITLK